MTSAMLTRPSARRSHLESVKDLQVGENVESGTAASCCNVPYATAEAKTDQ